MGWDFETQVPKEVVGLVGSTMTPEDLQIWWKTPNSRLRNSRPCDIWQKGGREEIVNFIRSVGDMV